MRVKKVSYICKYKLKILFSDGETKIVDLEDKIKNTKGIFSPLKSVEYFKKVALDDCKLSICWPNGADICPDVLYNMGIVINKKRFKIHKKNKKKCCNKTISAKISCI